MGRLCNFSLAILTQTQQDKYTECWWPDDSPCWNSGEYLPICCVAPKGSHVRLGYKPRVLLVWWSPQVVEWGEKTGTGQCCWDFSPFLCVWQPSSSPHVIAMVFCLVIGLKAMDGADLTWTGTPELTPQDSFFFFSTHFISDMTVESWLTKSVNCREYHGCWYTADFAKVAGKGR